jgi:hypothetical protein
MQSIIQGKEQQALYSPIPYWLFLMGDSKTALPQTWPSILGLLIGAYSIVNAGVIGATVASTNTNLAAALALGTLATAPVILINLGVNDFVSFNSGYGSTWIAAWQSLITGVRVKWPAATFYIMRPWDRGNDANAILANGWISTLVNTGTGLFLGPDEAIFYKGNDNGVSETYDGVHPSTPLGQGLICSAWQSTLGKAGYF